jgi:alkaline phosphatase
VSRRLLAALALVAVAVAGWWVGRAGYGPSVGRRELRIEAAPVGGLATPSDFVPPALADGPVRNVVLLVGDGFGIAQAAAARVRAFGPDGRFVFERFPALGLMATHPVGDVVTNSESGATAFASGEKTVNGRVGLSPDGRRLESLVERARAAGWLTGVVTSTHIFDATPAAFLAHVERRRDYPAVIEQIAASGVDFLAGGGREGFLPATGEGERTDGRNLLAEAEARGITVVRDVAALEAADRLPLWALFPGGRLGDDPPRPDLVDLAGRALDLLAAESDRRGVGFFLVVEEEEIDSGAHNNDLGRMTAGALRFDRAVERAARVAAGRGDTLVVVLADHSTGGLAIDQTSTAERLRVTWATGRHNGEPVPVWAYGPPSAAARFVGFHDNTEIHDRIAAAAGLERPAASAAIEPQTVTAEATP